jgi:glycosyltransferase involved in cell wall biosynthesis
VLDTLIQLGVERRVRILIATVQVPFIRGGAEIHAEGLQSALCAAGHEAEIVALPFKWYPPERILDHMLACRLLDLTESAGTPVDRVIGLKFPAYFVPHPNKTLWLLHQHKTAYELWDHPLGDLIHFPNGLQIRDAIRQADQQLIPQAKTVFTNSRNVSRRLKQYNGIDSIPLYHPPQHAEQFYCAEAEDFLFFPSRLSPMKRQCLVLEALAQTRQPVRVRFAGVAEYPAYAEELKALARKLRVHHRAEWLGQVSEEEKYRLYSHAFGVVYTPLDEDYGYVTLEAMLSSKPVITCADSGGPLEFVLARQTGLIAEPTPAALASAMDELYENRRQAWTLGAAGRDHYESLDISWSAVVQRLLA